MKRAQIEVVELYVKAVQLKRAKMLLWVGGKVNWRLLWHVPSYEALRSHILHFLLLGKRQ